MTARRWAAVARSVARRVVGGATRDHRRLRVSLVLTAAALVAWAVWNWGV